MDLQDGWALVDGERSALRDQRTHQKATLAARCSLLTLPLALS